MLNISLLFFVRQQLTIGVNNIKQQQQLNTFQSTLQITKQISNRVWLVGNLLKYLKTCRGNVFWHQFISCFNQLLMEHEIDDIQYIS